MGGGYTAQKSNICCITHNILATHKRARREREKRDSQREKQKPGKSGDTWAGPVDISKIELRVEYFSNITNMLHVFQKPNGFTTKCRGSNFKESSMGPGNFTTKCLALESPFCKLISIFIHGPWYFFYKMPWSAKVKVGPGPFFKVASLQNDL